MRAIIFDQISSSSAISANRYQSKNPSQELRRTQGQINAELVSLNHPFLHRPLTYPLGQLPCRFLALAVAVHQVR